MARQTREVKALNFAIEQLKHSNTILAQRLAAAQTDLSKEKERTEVELLKERTRFLSSLGQSLDTVCQAAKMAIGKEVM